MTYTRPLFDQAGASWQGAEAYTPPDQAQADAAWLSSEPTSYTRPLFDQAGASWQGAEAYTPPDQAQADAAWGIVTDYPDAAGTLLATLPAAPPPLQLDAAVAPVRDGALNAPLTPAAPPLSLQAGGESVDWTSAPVYTYPGLTAVDASWEGVAGEYQRLPYDQADGGWIVYADVDNKIVRVGTALITLAPPPFALDLSATERPPLPGDHVWARLPVSPPPALQLDAAGERINAAAAIVSLPFDHRYPFDLAAPITGERVHAGSLAQPLPLPPLLFLARIRERPHVATLDVALPPPLFPLDPSAAGEMVENAALTATLPQILPAQRYSFALAADAYQEIDLPERVEDEGQTISDLAHTRGRMPAQHGEDRASGAAVQQQQTLHSHTGTRTPHHHGTTRLGTFGLPSAEMIRFRHDVTTREAQSLPLAAGCRAPQTEALRLRNHRRTAQQQAIKTDCEISAPFAEAIRRRNRHTALHQDGPAQTKWQSLRGHDAIRTATRSRQDHQHGNIPLPGYWWPWLRCIYYGTDWQIREPYTRPAYSQADVTWDGVPQYCRDDRWVITIPTTPEPEPEPDQSIIVPIKRVYYMFHDIHVTRLSDSQQVPARQLEIALDADSHTWSCSATLVGRDALDLVQSDVPGEPVILVAHINGYDWHIIVDQWRESRQFGSAGINITGHGLTAEINAPWVLPQSGTVDSQMTVQQVFAALLPFGSGWTISWDTNTPDWIVPAGAWSWTNQTPISAIHSAATELGLVVVPDRAARTLNIMPRYPVAPWSYDTATPDITLPEPAITRYERQQPAPAQANAIYVHGSDVGGVIGHVARAGTAGDRMAATASHPLITHSDAARLLGTRRLAAEYQQPSWRSITLPLGGDLPLAEIGQLLEIDAGVRTERAVIAGIRVTVGTDDQRTTVRQQISLSENTDNRWARFRNLIPGSPTLLGEITATDAGTGTVTATLLGGGTIRARGTGTVGDQVYIRDSVVQGQAPDLPSYAIEV